ncbi:tRNA isopentenyltransferas-like protein [Eremomyces bilateralis CBS 781.70]|uniref:tRNA isopentenyltransferas-like protein n=1 Tax=Eremomyces bilateralis CBS 781.70 TaxID=1392243 RepID=A0A6G1G3W1_9PEZI|nr:tRNA isopentenyltransferas-like protein [Eremomyces bilateralis CBS 781.70]KAF1812785.1 tRNA isopentenyltransferas-like protein [Eremomyces bilateralis CBS 781.70]
MADFLQLAVEIARRFNGEIINGDAMQMYKGLPITTNKVTEEEQKGIHHHLLGCIGLQEAPWTVGKFVNSALAIIKDIHTRNKVPVVVGGTHYYTQSLIFKEALSDSGDGKGDATVFEEAYQPSKTHIISSQFPILDAPTAEIYAKLQEVDPVIAARWHPNDRRKIQRSLEIYLKTGKTASETYSDQMKVREALSSPALETPSAREEDGQEASNNESSLTRFPTLILWPHTDSLTLYTRLDSRVDTMLSTGLLSEVAEMDSFFSQSPQPIDLTRGVWVAIGYKEFSAYSAALRSGPTEGNEEENTAKDVAQIQAQSIEKTKAATRQYAKRQVRWIRIKLLNAVKSAQSLSSDPLAVPKMYLISSTSAPDFDKQVVEPALDLTSKFLAGEDLPDPESLSEMAKELLEAKRGDFGQSRELWEKNVCELCGVTTLTKQEWEVHVRGRKHRQVLKRRAKRERPSRGVEGSKKCGEENEEGSGDVIDGYTSP